MNSYVPTHVHSHFSLLDGLSKPIDIAKRTQQIGSPACAITDHGSISGAVAFINAMKLRSVKPIIGSELYICPGDPTVKDGNREMSHLVVLAKNLQGWKQLVKLTSAANNPAHFYYRPRLSLNEIQGFTDGNLIGFSGHMGSDLSKCIFNNIKAVHLCNTEEEAKQFTYPDWVVRSTQMAERLRDMFGKDNFFIEIQLIDNKSIPAVRLLVKGLRYISRQTGIPCIATPDAHYATHEDAIDQHILLCSSMDITMPDMNRPVGKGDVAMSCFFRSNNYHIPTYEEMVEAGNTEEELKNTLLVADMCEEYNITGPPLLPKFDCPDGLDSNQYLAKLCERGWGQRLEKMKRVWASTSHTESEYRARLDKEMNVLAGAGLADYFLIVEDILGFAKSRGQLTGAGRGSAGGSLVLYLLNGTHVDPIEYDLLFERFYNSGRSVSQQISFEECSYAKFMTLQKNGV